MYDIRELGYSVLRGTKALRCMGMCALISYIFISKNLKMGVQYLVEIKDP